MSFAERLARGTKGAQGTQDGKMLHDLMPYHGLVELSVWGYVAAALAMTHATIVSVTIFLHRHQTHRSLTLHPVVSHVFRFWLWISTGMVTREWVAVHRKHHATCETQRDPHSPQLYGIWRVLFNGVSLYRGAARDVVTVRAYGTGTPNDWIEQRVYGNRFAGIGLMLALDIALFGLPGLIIYAVQMLWIPFWAAGVVNGVGHYWGYRNFETPDESRNIIPIGVLIGGEELHNNHHEHAYSAKFSSKWWEFDIGWLYIRLLESAGLATVKRTARPGRAAGTAADAQTVDEMQNIGWRPRGATETANSERRR
jgi:stearoyl-CoA desaturase (Delta-9 desaturase)